MADLLIKNGRLLDPAAEIDGRLDILIRGGRVETFGAHLAAVGAKIIDARGLLVVPGLIDVHLHLMTGLGAFGADPDVFGVGSGVTTVVDAGSTGHSLFPIFRRHIAEPARTRVLAYVNLSTLGSVAGPGYSTLEDPRLIDEAKIEAAVEKHRDMIVGIKVMATGAALGKAGLEPLRRARRLGDNLHLPLLVHIGESWSNTADPPPVVNVLAYLKPGDIVTHMFTMHRGGLLDANGELWPEVLDAAAAGVMFDVGHGLHNFNFDVAQRVLDQGLTPDGVSTDGHRGNRAGPVYDLPTTMAKLLALGFGIEDVVHMTTVRAAKLLGRSDLGSIRVGAEADLSVLRLEEREWQARDSQAGTLAARQALVPVMAIRGESVYEALALDRP